MSGRLLLLLLLLFLYFIFTVRNLKRCAVNQSLEFIDLLTTRARFEIPILAI